MASAPSSSSSVIYFFAILIVIILLRLRRIVSGTRISITRTVLYSAYYVLFSLLVLSGSFFIGLPVEYFILYPIVFLVSFYLSYHAAKTGIKYWKLPDGSILAKGGLAIYFVYLAGLVLRVAIGYVFIGPNYFYFSVGQPLTLSPTAIVATIVTDLILLFGVGLLFGRNMQLLRKYRAYRSGKETIPEQGKENEDSELGSSMPS